MTDDKLTPYAVFTVATAIAFPAVMVIVTASLYFFAEWLFS